MLDVAELSRISSGVYRIVPSDGQASILLSGKLYDVQARAEELFSDPVVHYLVSTDSGTDWEQVNVTEHRHYHGEGQKKLLSWFYQLNCPMAENGFRRFAHITGVSAGRIKDALRRADTASFKPLSEQALLFLQHQVTDYLAKMKK